MGKTVIVVGAGASKEFGNEMPTGAELAERIQVLLEGELNSGRPAGPITEALMRSTGLGEEHATAMRRIRDGISGKDSIDDFIHEWSHVPQLPQVAKLCIAHCILEAEASTHLISEDGRGRLTSMRSMRESWLGQIVRTVNPGVPRRDVANSLAGVAFVTFNYDRCIERYLTGWFQMQGLLEEDLVDLRRQIPVHHVYGSLGHTLEWGGTVGFGSKDVWGTVRAAEGLKTYTEAVSPSEERQLFDLVDTADDVLLLGVGFHPQNLKLLFGAGGYVGLQRIWATSRGLRDRQRQRAKDYFTLRSPTSNVWLETVTASELLSAHRDEIFDA